MNVTPGQLFSGYTYDATASEVRIPIAALDGLTAAEANATTGNGMEVLRNIIDACQVAIAALATEARPTKASITKPNPSIATGVGVAPGTLRQTYSLSFDLTPTGLEPTAE
jgi:hypothetical protein